jgi:hypothetical protein
MCCKDQGLMSKCHCLGGIRKSMAKANEVSDMFDSGRKELADNLWLSLDSYGLALSGDFNPCRLVKSTTAIVADGFLTENNFCIRWYGLVVVIIFC